jgi:hypothetical protein
MKMCEHIIRRKKEIKEKEELKKEGRKEGKIQTFVDYVKQNQVNVF